MKLLDSLRSSHGKEESSGPRKITLQRKSKSEPVGSEQWALGSKKANTKRMAQSDRLVTSNQD